MFKKNEGTIDRVLRILIAVFLFYVAYSQVTGAAQIVLYILAFALLITGLVGYCQLYSLLKISTMKKDEEKSDEPEKGEDTETKKEPQEQVQSEHIETEVIIEESESEQEPEKEQ